jgi:Tol biopolymer transport system component
MQANLPLLTCLAVALALWACATPEAAIDVPWQAAPVKQYTFDEGIERDAAWSPDGKEIAFITGSKGIITEVTGSSTGADIWKMPASGGTPVQVTRGGFAAAIWTQVRWAPDGREIAFILSKGGNPNIWTVAATGGTPQQVTLLSGRKAAMSFSPDSRRLAFDLRTVDSWDIWTVPAAAANPRSYWQHLKTKEHPCGRRMETASS